MARDYRAVERDQSMLLPPDLRDWLPREHLVWLVIDVVDRLDLSGLHERYRRGGQGRQAFDPAMMTSLLIYAYCCGVRSSRRIEALCATDVAFRVVTGQQCPDHTTISRFRADHAAALADLFGQVLQVCAEAGMGKVGIVAIDGTKIAADASPRANRREERLRELAADILTDADQVDAAEDAEHGDRRGDELPPSLRPGADRGDRIRAALDSIEAENAERVRDDIDRAQRRLDRAEGSLATARRRAERIHEGRGFVRRDRRPVEEHAEVVAAQAVIDTAREKLATAQAGNGPAAGSDAKPLRRNTTDPDSRLMPNKHHGYLQGFNAQFAVSDDHLIIATDISTSPNDQTSFTPMMNRAMDTVTQHLPDRTIGVIVADAGYCSTANITAPGPDRLIATGRDPARTHRDPTIQKMADRLAPDTPDRTTYTRRQAIVEPVIGHIKDRIGLRAFSRRGIQAARHELALAATAHNIRRLATT